MKLHFHLEQDDTILRHSFYRWSGHFELVQSVDMWFQPGNIESLSHHCVGILSRLATIHNQQVDVARGRETPLSERAKEKNPGEWKAAGQYW
jgi:hypothetical protein